MTKQKKIVRGFERRKNGFITKLWSLMDDFNCTREKMQDKVNYKKN